jgi:hypothetical protein
LRDFEAENQLEKGSGAEELMELPRRKVFGK